MLAVLPDQVVPFVAVILSFAMAIIWTVMHYVASMVKNANLERSRREIAAYVAEGTIKPDEAVRLLNAGRPASEQRERTVA